MITGKTGETCKESGVLPVQQAPGADGSAGEGESLPAVSK